VPIIVRAARAATVAMVVTVARAARTLTAAVAVGAMMLVAGCAASPHSAATAARPAAGGGVCQPPPRSSITSELTLTMASSGRTYCVRVGDLVRMVFFGLPTAWLPVRLGGDALVPVTEAGSRKLIPGRPSNLYRAIRPGTATLTQSRLCAPLHPVTEPGIGSATTCVGRAASFRVVIIVS
jgi:hypothetical protein